MSAPAPPEIDSNLRPATKRLHLVIPGLIWPYQQAAQAHAEQPEFWSRLYGQARARTGAGHSLSTWLAGVGALPQSAWAGLSYLADTGCWPQDFCLQLDPVHLALEREELLLVEAEQLAWPQHELQQLAQDLAEFVAPQGWQLHAPTPERWYLRADQALHLPNPPLDWVRGANLEQSTLRAPEARLWQRWLTEIQMFLHQHPLNQNREQQQRATLNSLYAWGGTQQPAPPVSTAPGAWACSDAHLRAMLALQQLPMLDSTPAPPSTASTSVTVIWPELAQAVAYADHTAWLQALARITPQVQSWITHWGWQHSCIHALNPRLSLQITARFGAQLAFWRRPQHLPSGFAPHTPD